MKDGYLDIIDAEGVVTDKKELASIVHQKGLLHKTVHVWILNKKKELLIQKRSKVKWAYPELWEPFVGGHLSSGEDSIAGARAHVLEEVNLEVGPRDCVFLFSANHPSDNPHPNSIVDNEIHDVYLLVKDFNISQLKYSKDEISELKLITLEDFEELLSTEDKTITPHPEYYPMILDHLKQVEVNIIN